MINIESLPPVPPILVSMLLKREKPTLSFQSPQTSTGFLREGNRNSTMASIAGFIRSKGGTSSDIYAALKGLNQESEKPLDESELASLSGSIGSYPVNANGFLTNQGFAKLYADTYHDKVKYCPSLGFLLYNGTHWQIDDEGLKATALQIALADKIFSSFLQIEAAVKSEEHEKLVKAMSKLKDTAFLSKSLKLVKSDDRILVELDFFKAPSGYMNFKNGTLDLKTMSLNAHDPNQYFRDVLKFDYDPQATCPVFDKVLQDALPKNHADFLLRVMGYALEGTGREQRMFFTIGSGSNGKSVILEAISKLFGRLSAVLSSDSLTGKMSNQIRCDLVKLNGANLLIVNETEQGAILDSSLLKQITGGDTITARDLNKPFFDFKPFCVPVIISNFFPILDGGDYAMGRRLCIIPFNNKVTNPDRTIPEQLLKETSGIMNRLIAGYKDYKSNGLNIPSDITDLTRKRIDSRNLMKQFIEDCLIIGECDKPCPAQRLYNCYKDWCKEQGYKPMSQNQFKETFERETGLQQLPRFSTGYYWPSVTIKSWGGLLH